MLGYELIGEKRLDLAVEVFKLNVEAYPDSFNLYDSLVEAYMNRGDRDLAIKNYEKSLEVKPKKLRRRGGADKAESWRVAQRPTSASGVPK